MRTHVRFSVREIEELLTTALIFGFVFSFRDWGGDSFDYVVGASHLLQAFLVVLGSMLFVLLMQKTFAAVRGLAVEHSFWSKGVIASLLLGLLSNGIILLTLSSSFTLKRVRSVGHGKGVGLNHLSKVAGVGFFAHALLAVLGSAVGGLVPLYWLSKLVLFNVVYIGWNILPLPQLAGSMIFLWSRMWYSFALFACLGFVFLGLVGLPSFILAMAIGLCGAIYFFQKYEQSWT